MSKTKKIIDREFIKNELPTNNKGNIIWKESINKKFSIKYDGSIYNFIVTKYDNVNRIVYFINEEDKCKELHMYSSGLIKCNIGLIVGYLTTHFKYNINDIINGYIIKEQLRIKKSNGKSYRAYKVECLKDGYINIVPESTLDIGNGCPVCNNKIIIKGINDMWTTDPELAKLLANPNDGFLYSRRTGTKLNWKCPFCKSIVKGKAPSEIDRLGHIPCPYCYDGFTYPEKVMSCILSTFNIDFSFHYKIPNQTFLFENREYTPEYDFYFEFEDKKYIIEMDGGFHNRPHSKSELTIEQIKEIDMQKDILAKNNNIIMIRIDCDPSEYEHILESLKNSILYNMFDFSKINRTEINKKAYSSIMYDSCHLYMTKTKNLNTISKILKIPYGTVYRYLQRGAEIGICNYDPEFSKKNIGNLDFVGTYEVIL